MPANLVSSRINLFLAIAVISPLVVTEPSLSLPPSYPTTISSSSDKPYLSLPLTKPGAEFPYYNVSKGANITTPGNYSKHSLPSGSLTRVNIGQNHSISLSSFHFDFYFFRNRYQRHSKREWPWLQHHNQRVFPRPMVRPSSHPGGCKVRSWRWYQYNINILLILILYEGDDLVPVDISLVSGDILLFRDRLLWLWWYFFVAIKVTIFY